MKTAKTWNVALFGFGAVGKAFVNLLHAQREALEESLGFKARITLITTRSHGVALNPGGLDLKEIMKRASAKENLGPNPGLDLEDLLRASGAEVLLEATPTTRDGEAGIKHIRAALEAGLHVSTANKGPMALAYEELHALAAKKGKRLLFEGTVQGGTPLWAMIREGLAGRSFTGVQAILNCSTNFILTAMESGKSYEEACAEARAAELIEEDPSMDLEGWDATLKATILGKALFKVPFAMQDVERKGITQVTSEDIRSAKAQGERIKLVAELRPEDGRLRASVAPARLPLSHPLAQVDGIDNMVILHVDQLGTIALRGPGGGGLVTAQALLSDLLSIAGSD